MLLHLNCVFFVQELYKTLTKRRKLEFYTEKLEFLYGSFRHF